MLHLNPDYNIYLFIFEINEKVGVGKNKIAEIEINRHNRLLIHAYTKSPFFSLLESVRRKRNRNNVLVRETDVRKDMEIIQYIYLNIYTLHINLLRFKSTHDLFVFRLYFALLNNNSINYINFNIVRPMNNERKKLLEVYVT